MKETAGSTDTKRPARATLRCPFCLTLNRVDLGRADQRPSCGECGRPILVDRPAAVTDADLERALRQAEVPVLVDFYADWCGPCKMMAPVLDEFARDRQGELLVLKLDTDRNPVSPQKFRIRGVPTLILFREGREVSRKTGAVPRPVLEEMIDAS